MKHVPTVISDDYDRDHCAFCGEHLASHQRAGTLVTRWVVTSQTWRVVALFCDDECQRRWLERRLESVAP